MIALRSRCSFFFVFGAGNGGIIEFDVAVVVLSALFPHGVELTL